MRLQQIIWIDPLESAQKNLILITIISCTENQYIQSNKSLRPDQKLVLILPLKDIVDTVNPHFLKALDPGCSRLGQTSGT